MQIQMKPVFGNMKKISSAVALVAKNNNLWLQWKLSWFSSIYPLIVKLPANLDIVNSKGGCVF